MDSPVARAPRASDGGLSGILAVSAPARELFSRKPRFVRGAWLCAFALTAAGIAAAGETADPPAAAPIYTMQPAEANLYLRIQRRLFRDLPVELQEQNVILDPSHPVSRIKASNTFTTLPTHGGPWRNTVRVRSPGGLFVMPIPEGAEELPGLYGTVWYYNRLRIRLDVDVYDLEHPYNWQEALPSELHAPPAQPGEADWLAERVRAEFDELGKRDRFELWWDIFRVGAEDIDQARSFPERAAALYRLYRKAMAPRGMQPMRNASVRCFVSLPAVEDFRDRRTMEEQNRWVATAYIAPPQPGPMVRLTLIEPDHSGRLLTSDLVQALIANCRWDSDSPVVAGAQ